MSDELFESSMRDAARQQGFAERNERRNNLKRKPASVREIIASGKEGRMFTSKAGTGEAATRPINELQVVEATPVEIGRTLAVEEAVREAEAASRVVHTYDLPFDARDPRAYVNLDEAFPSEEAFLRFAEEGQLTDADIADLAAAAQAQRAARDEMQALNVLVPTWQRDIEPMIGWAKRALGLTDADLRQWFRSPRATDFHRMHEKWRAAVRDDASARAKKTGHLSDVGEQIAASLDEPDSAPRRRQSAEQAAMREGLMEDLRSTHVRGTELTGHESGNSIAAAARLFAKTLALGPDSEPAGEDAGERSLL